MSDASVATQLEFTEGHALVVGVGEYQAQKWNVSQVVADAQEIAAALVEAGAYPRQQVELLTGSKATRFALIEALTEMASRVGPDSTVFLFLSSHGDLGEDDNYYFVTSETEFLPSGEIRIGTGLSGTDLIALLRNIQAQRLICIINTCFSGGVGEQSEGLLSPGSPYTGVPLPTNLGRELLKDRGRALITSSQWDQTSHYHRASRHTHFGQVLIDGLRGKGVPNAEGYIGLYELYKHLYQETRAATAQQQEPMIWVVGGIGAVPLALHPRRGEVSSSVPLQAVAPTGTTVNVLPSPLDRAFADVRAKVLDCVRENWIEAVLDRGLYSISPFRPTLVDTPTALPKPLDMTIERYNRPPQPLPSDQSILKVFNSSGGRLLIRGEPGGGKTTLMLELARELISYAEREPLAPIPVVLLLRRWAVQKLPFAAWLVDQLGTVYAVSRVQAEEWVRHDRIVLLLDALDEVPPEAHDRCVNALNVFLADHGSVCLVLCCQTDAYAGLGVTPNLRGGSILIRPLDPAQVEDYLADGRLGGVQAALERSDELKKLARLPLMLNIMSIAYQGKHTIPDPEGDTAEAWSRQLFDAYIEQRLGQAYDPLPYPPEQIKAWLAWIAKCLAIQQQVDFYILRLEQVQSALDSDVQKMRSFNPMSPQQDWLPTSLLRRIYRSIAGTLFGFAIASVLILIWNSRLGWMGAVLLVMGVALGFGLLAALLPERTVAVAQVRTPSIDEAFGPALQRGVRLGLAMLVGLFTLIGVLGGVPLLGFASGCVIALVAGAFYLVAVRLARAFAQRWASPALQPTRRLLVFVLSVLAGGVFSGLICGLAGGVVLGWLVGQPRVGVLVGPLVGLLVGAIFGIVQGVDIGGQSLVNHYILRWLLASSGEAPWDLPGFLHYAAGLTLLYRVGDGYMFIHRRMMEHLAQLYRR